MTLQFELILDYPDEIGIKDNSSGDVIVEKVPQNINTVGFCSGVVDRLNELSSENMKRVKLNKFLEGFILSEGYTLEDIKQFIRSRTE